MNSIHYTNLQMFKKTNKNTSYKNMNTTFINKIFQNNKYYITHINNSRYYRIQNKILEQITKNHSLLNNYKKITTLTPKKKTNFPHKNIIMHTLKIKNSILININSNTIKKNNLYLFYSNKLNNELTNNQIKTYYLEH